MDQSAVSSQDDVPTTEVICDSTKATENTPKNPIVEEIMELSEGLSLEDLNYIYAELARKISIKSIPNDVMLLYSWQARKPKNRIVQFQFFPKEKAKSARSCVGFAKELTGYMRHWLFSDNQVFAKGQKRMSKREHKKLVASELLKLMKADGIGFQYRGVLDE